MKKQMTLLCLLMLLVALAGCGQGGERACSSEQPANWGVTLTARDVTDSGLTLVCRQSGGKPSGELLTGQHYTLEVWQDDSWQPVGMLPGLGDVVWTTEGWMIPKGQTVEWEMNWTRLYGQLESGQYRVGKTIMDFRGPGDFDECMHYACFEIE